MNTFHTSSTALYSRVPGTDPGFRTTFPVSIGQVYSNDPEVDRRWGLMINILINIDVESINLCIQPR